MNDGYAPNTVGSRLTPIPTEQIQNWTSGYIGKYRFEIMHASEPCIVGIDEGRITKLTLRRIKDRDAVAKYDNGWRRNPESSEVWEAVEALCAQWN